MYKSLWPDADLRLWQIIESLWLNGLQIEVNIALSILMNENLERTKFFFRIHLVFKTLLVKYALDLQMHRYRSTLYYRKTL